METIPLEDPLQSITLFAIFAALFCQTASGAFANWAQDHDIVESAKAGFLGGLGTAAAGLIFFFIATYFGAL